MSEALYGLIGVALGGLLSFLSSFWSENKKWKRERNLEKNRDLRTALGTSVKWIDHMQNSYYHASVISQNFLQKKINEDEFRKEWPKLQSALAKMDVEQKFIPILPSKVYSEGNQILKMFENAFIKSISIGQSFRHSNPEVVAKAKEEYSVLWNDWSILYNKIDEYGKYLNSELNKTYD